MNPQTAISMRNATQKEYAALDILPLSSTWRFVCSFCEDTRNIGNAHLSQMNTQMSAINIQEICDDVQATTECQHKSKRDKVMKSRKVLHCCMSGFCLMDKHTSI